MTGPAREILLTPSRLIPPAPASTDVAGAVLDFQGVVRAHEGPETIAGIDYEAHPAMARHQLDLLATEAFEKFPLLGLILHHRVGFVPVGEISLFLRVCAAHRGPAFEASQWLIDELKRRVPIWKHPVSLAAGPSIVTVVNNGRSAPAA